MFDNTGYVTDAEMRRLRSLVAVFTKTNRILSGDRKINVKLMPSDHVAAEMGLPTDAPGCSLYPNIWINYRMFQGFKSAKTLVQLLGLNYHELAHFQYTPRNYTVPYGCQTAWNILEDQRIESFFTATYGPSGKYFTEMVVRFYVEREHMWESAFAYTYGRSFLPLEIRQEFEDRFALPNRIEEVKELITQYKKFRAFHFRSKTSLVDRVVTRFKEILDEISEETGSDPENGCGNPNPQEGSPDETSERESQKKDRRRQEKEEESGEDQSGFWEDDEDDDEDESASGDEENGSGDSDDEEDEGEGEGDEEGEEGEGDSDSDNGDSSDGDSDSDDDSDEADDGNGEGSGSGDSDNPDEGADDDTEYDDGDDEGEGGGSGAGGSGTFDSDGDFEEYLNEIVEAVNEDEAVQEEVGVIVAAMNDTANIDVIDFGDEPFIEHEITAVQMEVVNKIGHELRRLYAEVEPGWKYGSDVGKLNVGRAMLDPENYDEMFDEWDEGREHEVGLEVFLACDISGSMIGREIRAASEALWIIKRALDEVEAKVTVVGFHETTVGLFSRDEKAPKTYWPEWTRLGGDTLPANSMHLGRRVLEASSMPNKLFVIITDGGLRGLDYENSSGSGPVYVNLADLIQTIPGQKIYVGIGNTQNYDVKEHCNVRVDLQDPMGLVMLVNMAVTKMLNERRR